MLPPLLPRRRRVALGALLALALTAPPPAFAQPPLPQPPGRVDALRQALLADYGVSEGWYVRRGNAVYKAIHQLRGLGELREALELPEWGLVLDPFGEGGELDALTGVGGPLVGAYGTTRWTIEGMRQSIIHELMQRFGSVLRTGPADARLAAIDWAGELLTTASTQGPSLQTRDLARRLAPELAHVATSPDYPLAVRVAATRSLGRAIPDPRLAADTIKSLLAERPPELRRAAAGAARDLLQSAVTWLRLQKLGEPYEAALGTLVSYAETLLPVVGGVLNDDDPLVQLFGLQTTYSAASGLTDFLPPPLPAPIGQPQPRPGDKEAPKVLRPDAALRLASALAAVIPEVAKAAPSAPLPESRLAAARTLSEIGRSRMRFLQILNPGALKADKPKEKGPFLPNFLRAMDAFAAGLHDPNLDVRLALAEAVEALGGLAIPAVPTLVEATRDPNLFVRWVAARTLGRLPPDRIPEPRRAEAVAALDRLLCDPDLDVRSSALTALLNYGPEGAAAARGVARIVGGTGGTEERTLAIRTLESLRPEPAVAVPALVAALNRPDLVVQRAAAGALGRIGPAAKGALDDLRQASQSPDAELRRAANEAIIAITTGGL